MNKGQILEWLDKNNRGFTQKDFELFEKFYKEATKELEAQIKELNYQKQARSIAENAVVDLTKENAELKGLVNQYKASKCSGISLVNRNMIMSDQLTKAEDILQRLMENQPTPSSMYAEIDLVGWREVNKEAKQFLKEIK